MEVGVALCTVLCSCWDQPYCASTWSVLFYLRHLISLTSLVFYILFLGLCLMLEFKEICWGMRYFCVYILVPCTSISIIYLDIVRYSYKSSFLWIDTFFLLKNRKLYELQFFLFICFSLISSPCQIVRFYWFFSLNFFKLVFDPSVLGDSFVLCCITNKSSMAFFLYSGCGLCHHLSTVMRRGWSGYWIDTILTIFQF